MIEGESIEKEVACVINIKMQRVVDMATRLGFSLRFLPITYLDMLWGNNLKGVDFLRQMKEKSLEKIRKMEEFPSLKGKVLDFG